VAAKEIRKLAEQLKDTTIKIKKVIFLI